MAFCFKRKESVSKAIRRLSCGRIENALKCLKDCDRPEAIHCARKEIKKARAVLRLVRARMPKKQFSRPIGLLRQATDQLAPPRDAYIKAKTLRDLAHHFKGQLGPGSLRHIRATLREASDKEMKRFVKKKRVVNQRLRRVTKEVDDLDVSGKGWKLLGPGVKAAYRQGRRAYRTVLKDSSPENFHEWRKRAKDLWYQVTLLHPVWPEQMDAMASELETLGEYLGDDHDLVVLQEGVREQCSGNGAGRELETLEGLTEQRQRELRGAALALGARFYAEKPSTFCNRLAGYWHTWRCEKKRIARSAQA